MTKQEIAQAIAKKFIHIIYILIALLCVLGFLGRAFSLKIVKRLHDVDSLEQNQQG